MKKKIPTYTLVAVLFIVLILIRAFEDSLFYDPFLDYFKNNYLTQNFPEFSWGKLLMSLVFRYVLNMLISLGIVYVLFKKLSYIKFALVAYAVGFVVLAVIYCWLLAYSNANNYLTLFYVRRFLIHPVFVLILIPAFYYQSKLARANG